MEHVVLWRSKNPAKTRVAGLPNNPCRPRLSTPEKEAVLSHQLPRVDVLSLFNNFTVVLLMRAVADRPPLG